MKILPAVITVLLSALAAESCANKSDENTDSVTLGTLSGKLTQSDGTTAISGAKLTVSSTAGLSAKLSPVRFAGAVGQTATTDSNGIFEIKIEPGKKNIIDVEDSGGNPLGKLTAPIKSDGRIDGSVTVEADASNTNGLKAPTVFSATDSTVNTVSCTKEITGSSGMINACVNVLSITSQTDIDTLTTECTGTMGGTPLTSACTVSPVAAKCYTEAQANGNTYSAVWVYPEDSVNTREDCEIAQGGLYTAQ